MAKRKSPGGHRGQQKTNNGRKYNKTGAGRSKGLKLAQFRLYEDLADIQREVAALEAAPVVFSDGPASTAELIHFLNTWRTLASAIHRSTDYHEELRAMLKARNAVARRLAAGEIRPLYLGRPVQ